MSPTHTTGLPGLDAVLGGVLAGDNIVWRVGSVEDYRELVMPYIAAAVRDRRRLIYFRFARHAPLLTESGPAEIHALDPAEGFESFIHRIHHVIGAAGLEAYYVFDCLSDLAVDWYSDAMLGNFFALTCPYLFELKTIAFFGLLREGHAPEATEPIAETTQLFLDVHRRDGVLYLRPLKAQFRDPPALHKLYAWREDGRFEPVASSALIAAILTGEYRPGRRGPEGPTWDRVFERASGMLAARGGDGYSHAREEELRRQMIRMIVSRDENMLSLAESYLDTEDLLGIRRRMIGSGLIGGKTVGMLIARRILVRQRPSLAERFEEHDSFYIGSDVFYTYIVRNGVWPLRQRQRDPGSFLDGAAEARQRLREGFFPEPILRAFDEMLDYFGPYPIIVRSSSLLEDNFGNAFAGKYESIFCANQGTREQRRRAFLDAVREVYASCMSPEALRYRERHGLLDRDEQMALLVMRVSGSQHGTSFFPHLAGVGFSYNPYAWSPDIDPRAGVVRLVFGLGTRAVDRVDDDYTRVVALNAPTRRPEADFDEVCRYSQRKMDFIDLEANRLTSGDALDMLRRSPDAPIELLASEDRLALEHLPDGAPRPLVLTFDELVAHTPFVQDMRDILGGLADAYRHPVDAEFTANFMEDGAYRINLLQCRPLQAQGTHQVNLPEVHSDQVCVLLEARGAVVGRSRVTPIDRVIYIVPEKYGRLGEQARYEVASWMGALNRATPPGWKVMMVAPGRWGTSTPSLGVPVSFSDISRATVLVEIEAMHGSLVPDVSLGTHFFNELVEMDMLYLALFPRREGNRFDAALFDRYAEPSSVGLDISAAWREVIRIVDSPRDVDDKPLFCLVADAIGQTATLYCPREMPVSAT